MPSAPSCDRRRYLATTPRAKRAHAQYSLALSSPCLFRVSAYSLCHGLITFTALITVYVPCRDDDGGARPLHAPRSEPPRVCTRYHILKNPIVESNPALPAYSPTTVAPPPLLTSPCTHAVPDPRWCVRCLCARMHIWGARCGSLLLLLDLVDG
jgi:hypothetical protein